MNDPSRALALGGDSGEMMQSECQLHSQLGALMSDSERFCHGLVGVGAFPPLGFLTLWERGKEGWGLGVRRAGRQRRRVGGQGDPYAWGWHLAPSLGQQGF